MCRVFLLVGQKNYEHFTLIFLGIGEKYIRVFVIIVILLAYNAISKAHAYSGPEISSCNNKTPIQCILDARKQETVKC